MGRGGRGGNEILAQVPGQVFEGRGPVLHSYYDNDDYHYYELVRECRAAEFPAEAARRSGPRFQTSMMRGRDQKKQVKKQKCRWVGHRRGTIIIEAFYYYFVPSVTIFFDSCMIYVFS